LPSSGGSAAGGSCPFVREGVEEHRAVGGDQPRPDGGPPEGGGMKTNAGRLLGEMGGRHELRACEGDPDDLTAEAGAAQGGLSAAQVFKRLGASGDRHGVCFAVVPGDCRLDLKALARLTGDRKAETVSLKEVQPLTGYVRGGVTVLGARKAYPV